MQMAVYVMLMMITGIVTQNVEPLKLSAYSLQYKSEV